MLDKKEDGGLKTAVKNFSDSAVARQTRSARRTARHLGMASARKNTSSAAHTAAMGSTERTPLASAR